MGINERIYAKNNKGELNGNWVDLSGLPRWGKKGMGNEGSINWSESIGFNFEFKYRDTCGYIDIVDYKLQKLYLKHLDGEAVKLNIKHIKGCHLGSVLGVITSKFKLNIGDNIKDNTRDITVTEMKRVLNPDSGRYYKWYKYICNKCGFDCGEHYSEGSIKQEYWVEEHNLINKFGCVCCGTIARAVVPGINDIPTTAPFMVKYFSGGYDEARKYSKSSNKKIIPICPDCKRILNKELKINNIYTKKSVGCSCGDGKSYPEKFVFSFLEQLDLEFITEYSPLWIGIKRYDFYIAKYNIIIETDGTLGHGKGVHGKSNKTVKETIDSDKYKDEMALKNKIEVIRLDCTKSDMEFIKNSILNSKLNELFYLNKIDWNKCDLFTFTNKAKDVCDYWNIKMEHETTLDLQKIFKTDRCTIIRYLKKGNIHGWCSYDTKEESRKGRSKSGKRNGIPIEMFKDNISIGIFNSATELCRNSQILFGIRFHTKFIDDNIKERTDNYKGYTFKYVNQQ